MIESEQTAPDSELAKDEEAAIIALPDSYLPETYPFDNAGALCREYLLERGYCCSLGCRNCPYRDDDDLSP